MTVSAITAAHITEPHAFYTREGGVSQGLYASLNCGFGAIGDPRDNVVENRRRAAVALGADCLVGVYQHHSSDAVWVDQPWSINDAPKADALATATPGVALAILTADCAPVLLADAKAGVVGAAHAGWRGALAGVTDAVIDLMIAHGVQPQHMTAAVGPCVTQPNYQVDAGFRAAFDAADPQAAACFAPDPESPDHWRFDLPGYVLRRLTARGVGLAAFVGECTYAQERRFFSNRRRVHRGEPDYGRGLSAIMRRP